jgi:lycopene beta-cyclase
VEYVSLDDDREGKLEYYLHEVLGIQDYKVVYREQGVNPMTDCIFPRIVGKRIVNIGRNGGLLKPSSGYGFARFVADSKNIAALLVEGKPLSKENLVYPRTVGFYWLADRLLLQVMTKHPRGVREVFRSLLVNNRADVVLRFLDERCTALEIISIGLKMGISFRWFILAAIELAFSR